jgi:hypothetical protein
MSTRKQHWIGWAVACGIIAGILAVLCGGCKTLKLKHEAAKFDKVMAHAKVDSVIVRVDSVHTDTVTIFGDVQSVNCDSIVRAAMDDASLQAMKGTPVDYRTKTVVKWKTPIETFIFDTVWKSRDVYVENGAKVQLLQKKLAVADGSHMKMRSRRDMWRVIAILFFVMLIMDLLIRKGKTVNVRA